MSTPPECRGRVAIVQDYLTQLGGAERVVLAMARALPGSRLITSVYAPAATFPEFRDLNIETMWVNRSSVLRHDPRLGLPVLGAAFRRHELHDVDVVLCSSSGWAHGISTSAPKIVYCHTPARWLYEPDYYFGALPAAVRRVLHAAGALARRRDRRWANEAAAYLVNSSYVQERVRRNYGIEARVLAPPPGLLPDGPVEAVPGVEPGFLLSVARPRGYKNVAALAMAVEAVPGERLVAVGGVPRHPAGAAWGPRITQFDRVNDAQLRWLYANAAVLVAISHEDFGLTPVEAFGFGTPVLALHAGGYLDTCVEGLTGVWINDISVPGILDGLARFRAMSFDREAIVAHSEQWSPQRFADQLASIIKEIQWT